MIVDRGKKTFEANGSLENPNPKRKRGTISPVPHLRIGLGLVVFTSPLFRLSTWASPRVLQCSRPDGHAVKRRNLCTYLPVKFFVRYSCLFLPN